MKAKCDQCGREAVVGTFDISRCTVCGGFLREISETTMNLPYNHPASQTLSAAISDATDTARRCALHYLCGALDIARPGEIQPDRLRADIILQLLQKDEHPKPQKS